MPARGQPLPERAPVLLPHEAIPVTVRGYVCRHCDQTTGPDMGECWARHARRAEAAEAARDTPRAEMAAVGSR